MVSMKSDSKRLPTLYFLSYLPLGMIYPYLVQELELRSIAQIGILLAMPPFVQMFLGPLWGWLADWSQRSVLVLQMAVWISILGLTALTNGPAEWAWLAMLVYSIGWAPIAALMDAITLELLQRDERSLSSVPPKTVHYGSIRMWGSVGYLVGVAIIGLMTQFLMGWGLKSGTIATIILGLFTFFLPPVHVEIQRPNRQAVWSLLQNRTLRWILLCAGLHFSVHLGNSVYIVSHAKRLNIPEVWASLAIVLGVLVEIVVFQCARKFEHYAPQSLFLSACLLAIPRWVLMLMTHSILGLCVAQALHGITFGVFWLAAVRMVKAITPSAIASTGQSLLSTSVGGIGAVIGMYGASWIVDNFGTHSFYGVSIGIACLASLGALRLKWLTN